MFTTRRIPRALTLLAAAILLSQCGSSVYYVQPPDWKEEARRDSVIRGFSDVLQGKTIFIDPGHGGDDRKGVGPAQEVCEADVNLRVALALRISLKRAGANVLLTRESDQTVPLESRVQQANTANADIFVSVHHNSADNPFTNYTATFYHAKPGAPGYKPSSHDLARYIQRDLAFVMGNPGSLASFDGTLSDDLIYPGAGFAVLREARMTSVLVECGFFSSAYEEQRLRIEEFNEIQAWGIFRGIAKYLQAGVPALAYDAPTAFAESRPKIDLRVIDRTEIKDESIRAWVNGKEEGFIFNAKTGKITVTTSEDLPQGYHRLAAQVRNRNENSSAPFERFFAVGRPPAVLRSSVDPPVLPPDSGTYSIVTITAVDSTGVPLGDGLPVRFTTSAGMDTTLVTKQGVVRAAIAPGVRSTVSFEASNGPVKTEGAVTTSADALYTRGIVMGAEGKPVIDAAILLPGGKEARTNDNGEYIITGVKTGGMEVTVRAPGYFARREAFNEGRVQDPVILAPVAKGTLHGKTVLLELLSPLALANPSRTDARMIAQLADLLAASGGHVVLLHKAAASKKERQELLALHKSAPLIQAGMQAGTAKIMLKVNGAAASKTLGETLVKTAPGYASLAMLPMLQRMVLKEEEGKMKQVAVYIPMAGSKSYDDRGAQYAASTTAWAVYAALAASEGYKSKGTRSVEVTVTEKGGKTPAAYAVVELNQSLRAISDAKGIAVFRAVSIADDDVRVIDAEKYEINGVKTEVVN
ncbi:MAG: N-acetylmuramoyl-L-alanine amidase [Ignavibacteria bacterium]|nr:N-acetylmuramoyl-L-alanine amidase [Ignavibacteria bacterium]